MNHADHSWEQCPELHPAEYYGPCRAGLHPEFGWGTPCLNDATEYVGVDSPTVGVRYGDTFLPAESLMRLCSDHAAFAELLPGFHSRKPLAPPALTYPRPECQA